MVVMIRAGASRLPSLEVRQASINMTEKETFHPDRSIALIPSSVDFHRFPFTQRSTRPSTYVIHRWDDSRNCWCPGRFGGADVAVAGDRGLQQGRPRPLSWLLSSPSSTAKDIAGARAAVPKKTHPTHPHPAEQSVERRALCHDRRAGQPNPSWLGPACPFPSWPSRPIRITPSEGE